MLANLNNTNTPIMYLIMPIIVLFSVIVLLSITVICSRYVDVIIEKYFYCIPKDTHATRQRSHIFQASFFLSLFIISMSFYNGLFVIGLSLLALIIITYIYIGFKIRKKIKDYKDKEDLAS